MADEMLAIATLKSKSGIARDDIKNSFVMRPVVTAGDHAAVANAVRDFYTVLRATGQSIETYLGPQVRTGAGALHVDVYSIADHLDGSNHGSPIGIYDYALNGSRMSTAGLPTEVAAVLSFEGSGGAALPQEGTEQMLPTPKAAQRMGAPATHLGRIRPRARRRGRIYIGPLWAGAITNDATTGQSRIVQGVRDTIAQSALALMASTNVEWYQWSRRDAHVAEIVTAWVDDAADTQRRRGERAVAKSIVTGP